MNVCAIVSAYYAEPYIERRLANLLNHQPRPQICVIAQQDSFEYKTASRLLAREDILIATPDIPTLYAAWNMGVRATNKPLLTNANCDDLLLPGGLDALLKGILAGAAISYGQIYRDDPEKGKRTLKGVKRKVTAENLQGGTIGPMPMWRRELHDTFGMFREDFIVVGDYEFWMRCAVGGVKIVGVTRPIGVYLVNPTSIEHRNLHKGWDENKQVREMYERKHATN